MLPRRLGPTALEPPDDLLSEEGDGEGEDLPDVDLQLGEDSALLGDGELNLNEAPGGIDPTLRLGGPSDYNLGGGDFMLELNE